MEVDIMLRQPLVSGWDWPQVVIFERYRYERRTQPRIRRLRVACNTHGISNQLRLTAQLEGFGGRYLSAKLKNAIKIIERISGSVDQPGEQQDVDTYKRQA